MCLYTFVRYSKVIPRKHTQLLGMSYGIRTGRYEKDIELLAYKISAEANTP